jgi:glucose uptake protein
MILPGSYVYTLIVLILSMLCWGSWANTFKLTGGKWRFELFYFDFAVGALLASLIAALTFGSLGWDGFSFLDDLRNAGKRQDAFAFVAGCIFNLANMLLVGAISIAGMSVAFPIGIGLALIIGVIWSFLLHPVGNPLLLGAGCTAIIGAVIFDAMAYRLHAARQRAVSTAAPQERPLPAKGPLVRGPLVQGKAAAQKASSVKGIVLSVVSGILMGSFYPLVEIARTGEIGLGPYAAGFVFAVGIFFSTFVFNMFFMNLPVQGQPVEIRTYFRGRGKNHLLGLLGGSLWYIGAVSNFAAARAEGAAQAGPAVSYAMGQGATLISALWGLIVWKEFAGAESNVKSFLAVMLFLFILGLATVSVAPLYSRH